MSAVFMASLAMPVDRSYYYKPPQYKKSIAIGGDSGDGGDAVAVGADVTAGIGGSAVGGADFNLNKGYQVGGDGYADVTAANGAVGSVSYGGSIDGDFHNEATGGDSGDGGDATIYH
ncbi:wiskott-Aldrich syndrome protein family member 2 [Gracilaria domingensis]|nr:wiskott-Aldrich syndrome protein family member 2 [Gracilaria domingensis]